MSWNIQMEETDDGFIMSKGFVELVRDLGLEFGDFAIFWRVERRTFRIVVYGRDQCEKDVPPRHTGDAVVLLGKDSCNKEVKWEDKSMSEHEGVKVPVSINPHFIRGLKPYEKYILNIFAGFIKETGLNRYTNIKIRNPNGDRWEVELRKMHSTSRYCICRRHDIFIANKMNIGDILVFTSHEGKDNQLDVKLLGKEGSVRLTGQKRFFKG